MDPSLRALIEQAEFKESFRGYDRTQVDDMLERLATQAGKLESDLADVETRVRAEAQAEVDARVAATLESKQGGSASSEVDEQKNAEEVRLTLVMAQRTADAAIREAREKAETLLSGAQEKAEKTTAEARDKADKMTADARAQSSRERQKSRKELADEVAGLDGIRTTLQTDIQALEEHLREQREQLIASLDDLRHVLDNPQALRVDPAPPTTQVDIPDPPEDLEEEAAKAKAEAGDAGRDGSASSDAAPNAETDSADAASDAQPVAPGAPAAGTPASTTKQERGPSVDATVAMTAGSSPISDQPGPGVVNPGVAEGAAPSGSANGAEVVGGTASVDVATEEDGFLTELRRAMTDDEPLGPRKADDGYRGEHAHPKGLDGEGGAETRPKSRFSRRR